MSTRELVLSAFEQVAADHGQTLTSLVDGTVVAECGLDSMSFAIVLSHLEDSLGVDPFAEDRWVDFPTTLGELVRLYEREVAGSRLSMTLDGRTQRKSAISKRFRSL